MPTYTFDRESRTPYSECYVIEEEGDAVGRVDIHFTPSGVVHATLCVPQDFDENDIEELVAEVDERLVLSALPFRDDLAVTVWRGTHAGVYSEEDDVIDDEVVTNGL